MAEQEHLDARGKPLEAPEHVPNAVRPEPGGNVQMEDINIPVVAISVAFFAVLLAVGIVTLQAWIYNAAAAEKSAKTLAQEDPRTELGGTLARQRSQLAGIPDPAPATLPAATATATTTATAAATQPKLRIPVQTAMQLVAKQYSEGAR